MKMGENKAVKKTVRKLKTAQSNKTSASVAQESEPVKRSSRKITERK